MNNLSELRQGKYIGFKRLKISENLKEFPIEILALADTLEILDLSGNHLNRLPKEFGQLKQLKILFLSQNQFSVLPEVLSDCPNLQMIGFKSNSIKFVPEGSLPKTTRWLILTDNRIEQLPDAIGDLVGLQKCMLAGNLLKKLPENMQSCVNIELLRISANQLTSLPDWLLRLPKLAWLAFAGNPISSRLSVDDIKLPHFNMEDFSIIKPLGEGASGTIYLAENNRDTVPLNQVAIKLYKGSVTSDGYPGDELSATIAAGAHGNLVKNLARVSKGDQLGLVMDLIPSSYQNLGLPPSLDTCTRDQFSADTRIDALQAKLIAISMAKVLCHLHSKKISHGDAYAHNMLINKQGHVLFGDFGAATLYGQCNLTAIQEQQIQQIEVRAFGYLLEDLIGLMPSVSEDSELLNLTNIKDMCLDSEIQNRPLFSDLIGLIEDSSV